MVGVRVIVGVSVMVGVLVTVKVWVGKVSKEMVSTIVGVGV